MILKLLLMWIDAEEVRPRANDSVAVSSELIEGHIVSWNRNTYIVVETCSRQSNIVKVKTMYDDIIIEITDPNKIEDFFNATQRKRRCRN